jgi:hypothetical protein
LYGVKIGVIGLQNKQEKAFCRWLFICIKPGDRKKKKKKKKKKPKKKKKNKKIKKKKNKKKKKKKKKKNELLCVLQL